MEALEALEAPPAPTAELPYMLISGARRAASFNSWTHNMPKLAKQLKGNWATIHPDDAARLGVVTGDRVRIRSAAGELEIEVRPSPKILVGVVSIHQHWGHTYGSGMKTAERYPGVNVNRLHSDKVRDVVCGMPVFNGTPVSIERVEEPGSP